MYYQQPSVRYSGPTQVGPQPGVVGVEYRQLSGGAVPAVSTVTPTVSTVPRTVAPAHSQVQNVQYRNLTTGAISSAPPQVLGTAPVTQNIQNVEYRNLTTGAVSSAPPALSGGTVPTTVPAPPALSGGTVPTTVPGTAPGTTIEKVEYRNLTTGEVTSAHPGASPQNVEYTTPVPATVPSAPAEIYSRPDFGMESELPKLYVQKISCNCLGPWLLLKESGIPFELVVVDITKGDSHTPEFLALNPMGKVPVFVGHDGMVVWESNTIMRYICEKYPVPDHFFPRDVNLRGRVEMALDWRQSVLMPNLCKVAYPQLGFSKDSSRIQEGKEALNKDLKVLTDFFLHETPFIGGTMPCIADYAIALPLLYLYVTDYRTPGKVREYLETLASKTPSWNEVTLELKNFMSSLK